MLDQVLHFIWVNSSFLPLHYTPFSIREDGMLCVPGTNGKPPLAISEPVGKRKSCFNFFLEIFVREITFLLCKFHLLDLLGCRSGSERMRGFKLTTCIF